MIPRYIAALLFASFGLAQTSNRVPKWQIDAGSKMAFEVASIKPGKPDTFVPPNFPVGPDDAFINAQTKEPPNGRFSASFPLSAYIVFAYKLRETAGQREAMLSHLPKWVSTDAFEIQARAPGNATKDQMRLMMQSLLAERFQLAVHFETHEASVLAMTLIKHGKPGPALRPHAEGPPCDAPASQEIYPPVCDAMIMTLNVNGQRTGGARNTTMDLIAWYLPGMGILERPVIDRTGLTGRFDFKLTWAPDPASLPGPGSVNKILKKGSESKAPEPAAKPELATEAPGFIQALREQLGLKLESSKGAVETLVIDRVERPSEN